ncbi:uncharacterized protein LOC129778185 [Toxorhynchites rutilus septentrionalis]|nr:uncharacterized protein LOC129778185 [Toxorhynchites rutilus septentrionalis]
MDRQRWKEGELEKATQAIKDGFSLRKASRVFAIPRTTLMRIVQNSSAASEETHRTVFSSQQEQEMLNHVLNLQSRLYGLTARDIRKMAFELAEKNRLPHPFNPKTRLAGRDWFIGFMKRHPTISMRTPEGTSVARARAFNKPSVQRFFDVLESKLNVMQYTPSQIYNVDETSVSTVPNSSIKIAAKKGQKRVGIITSAERGESTTVVMCMSASGHYIPPMIIFPRMRMNDQLKTGAPHGTTFACNPSGYMTTELFSEWFKHFVQHARPTSERPLLLILDGHSSHSKNFDFCETAAKMHVVVIVLPPHCSHRMQPLDVSFMGPFKKFYGDATGLLLKKTPGKAVTQYDIAGLVGIAFPRAATQMIAANGFSATGICPFNREIFEVDDFAPAEVTNQPETETISSHDQTQFDGVDQAVDAADDSFEVGPSDIIPLPKAIASNDRKRIPDKSCELTATSHRKSLLEAEVQKSIKAMRKVQKKVVPKRNRKRKGMDSDVTEDVLCEYCAALFSQSQLGWMLCISCKVWYHNQCTENESVTCPICML